MLRIFSNLLIVMVLATTAFAETVRLAWNPPVTRENGEKMELSEVSYYVLRLDDKEEEVVKANSILKDLSVGSHSFSVFVCDINGMCSTKTIKNFTVKPQPKKPKYLSVSIVK